MKKMKSTICAMALLLLVYVQPVYASSYNTTLKMSAGTYQYCSNNYRKFDGNSITMLIDLDVYGSVYSDNSQARLKASLYRKTTFSRSYISYQKYEPGTTKKTWSNVGPGKYVWSFDKECGDYRDTHYYTVFESDNVKMYN